MSAGESNFGQEPFVIGTAILRRKAPNASGAGSSWPVGSSAGQRPEEDAVKMRRT
jgi:hypothetical protein